MNALQTEISEYLSTTGESMRSLSLRAGLSDKAVSDIVNRDGCRPLRTSIDALTAAMGRELPVDPAIEWLTYAELIQRLPAKVAAEGKAKRYAQRMRWLLRAAGWVAEFEAVDRRKIRDFFAKTSAATFGLSDKSFATYKAEVMSAVDVALPRARGRGIADLSGPFARVHDAIKNSDLPKDLSLVAGSFLVFLHDRKIQPSEITTDTLADYYAHRTEVSAKDEATARKHVKRIATLLKELARRPEFAPFGFTDPAHPFTDGRDRYGVPDETIASIMAEFDTRIAPWALGHKSRDGKDFAEFLAWLDAQKPTAGAEKRALLRRSGIKARNPEGTKSMEASLSAHGFLLPKARWSETTLAGRRGFVAAGVKALYARSGYLVSSLDELTDPEVAWAIASALIEANETGFSSGYAASVMKTIIKIAELFLTRPDEDIAELRGHAAALATPKGMSERNIAKLRHFTPARIPLFLSVSDKILEDVNLRSDRRRRAPNKSAKRLASKRFDVEQCRDIMCALAHELMLVRAPRSANVLNIRLNWIRWDGDRAMIVVPADEVKMRDQSDPDLVLDLPLEASRLLRQWIEKIRPLATQPGDGANPYLFPGQGKEPNQSYGNLLNRLAGWVLRVVGAGVHPHLYRHLIGWIWLRDDLSMLPAVQNLLGHKSVQTTINYYAAIDSSLAMQRWQDHLDAQRKKA